MPTSILSSSSLVTRIANPGRSAKAEGQRRLHPQRAEFRPSGLGRWDFFPRFQRLPFQSQIHRLLPVLALASTWPSLRADLPKIAVFSGPTATIQNNEPFVTSIKARKKYGLPPLKDEAGLPMSVDALRPQRLAAPVTVYIEQFSAHPLESDVKELYGPPDGYVDPSGKFHPERTSPNDKPVFEVTLEPSDGLYPLPYMARQADGRAWESNATDPNAPFAKSRQTFYPDASRIFEEIEREGANLSARAHFDFYRAAPSGGYTKGLAAALRTDVGQGDIPPEKPGIDFFQYGAYGTSPTRAALAKATNLIQRTLASNQYAGSIWFEGSPNIEDSTYWFSLLIDTTKPMAFNAAQRDRGKISPDGDDNIIDSVNYLLSSVWADDQGRNRLGAVMIQDQLIYSAREVTKGDARPGGYIPSGGLGGYIGNTHPMTIGFVPNKKSTSTSEVRFTKIPASVFGVHRDGSGKIAPVAVPIKTSTGDLLPTSIPYVVIFKGARWSNTDDSKAPDKAVDVLAQLERVLKEEPLAGFVGEGNQGGSFVPEYDAALSLAVCSGLPVVKVSRGNPTGFVQPNDKNLFIEGNNLTSTKARLLLMACLMKFGALPPAADPVHPTAAERAALSEKIKAFQAIFDTH